MSSLEADVDLFNDLHAQIVQVGKEYCRPRPVCTGCPLNRSCPTGRARPKGGVDSSGRVKSKVF